MTRRLSAVALAATLALSGAAASAEDSPDGPPAEVLDKAFGAAAEAHRVAHGLTKPKNPNSAAGLTKDEKVTRKAERRAAHFQALAEKHAARGKGHASAVHDALARGESPSSLAGLNADAAKAMAKANKALRKAAGDDDTDADDTDD